MQVFLCIKGYQPHAELRLMAKPRTTFWRRHGACSLTGETLHAARLLDGGEYKLTVATVCETGRMCVRIGGAEIAFPCRTA